MSTDKRPGGLTALAIINFILGARALVVALFLPVMGPLVERYSPGMTDQQRAQTEALTEIGATLLVIVVVGYSISALLAIASGIGYLKLKRFLGRTVGNVGALYSIVATMAGVLWLPPGMNGGFSLMVLLSLWYAALTLLLLNVTFKEDLVN